MDLEPLIWWKLRIVAIRAYDVEAAHDDLRIWPRSILHLFFILDKVRSINAESMEMRASGLWTFGLYRHLHTAVMSFMMELLSESYRRHQAAEMERMVWNGRVLMGVCCLIFAVLGLQIVICCGYICRKLWRRRSQSVEGGSE